MGSVCSLADCSIQYRSIRRIGVRVFGHLPQINALGHYRPISNTVLYDDKGREFGSFALQRRTIAQYEDYPKVLYDAVLSIEDKNFEKHSGFEVWRMFVAAFHNLRARGKAQGASTLTMQLARNLFLSQSELSTANSAKLCSLCRLNDTSQNLRFSLFTQTRFTWVTGCTGLLPAQNITSGRM